MTIKDVLSDVQRKKICDEKLVIYHYSINQSLRIIQAVEQAIMQTPEIQQMRKDAELWRALIGCARIRPLGSAGLVHPAQAPDQAHLGLVRPAQAPNYAHLGLELWTKFSRDHAPALLDKLDRENQTGREWLTKFAEAARRAALEQEP